MKHERSPGTLVHHRYRIEHLISSGSMGAVYRALDTRFNNAVALKCSILTDVAAREAFAAEAQLLARLRHPNVPKVIDYFIEQDDQQWLVMEFIAGQDLAELLVQQGEPLPVSDVLYWAEQVLEALDYLHNQEPPIIHRDIKPSNLKLSPRGDLFLLDFGIAKGDTQTILPGSGTAAYAAPEQIDGMGTMLQSDLYSLAATIYHLITNERPYTPQARLREIIAQRPDPLWHAHAHNSRIPVEVSRALQRGLALDPPQRYASAAEMRRYVCLDQGRYRKIRTLSQSVVSSVYEAEDTSLGLHVVIKQVQITHDEHAEAIEANVHSLTRFAHPVLPRFIDVYRRGKFVCLVTEFIAGPSIFELVTEQGKPFEVAQVIRWAYQLLDMLDHLHNRQPPLVHRNIRPHNLKLTGEENIVLVDLGAIQTDVFAPPEEVANTDFTARSDLYTLGATMYYMLTSESPTAPFKRAAAINAGQPDPLAPVNVLNPTIPPNLSAMVAQTMALDPEQRPATAVSMRQMLAQITLNPDESLDATSETPNTMMRLSTAPSRQQRRQVQPRSIVFGVAACIALILLGVILVQRPLALEERSASIANRIAGVNGSNAPSGAPRVNLLTDNTTVQSFPFAVRSIATASDNSFFVVGGADGSLEAWQIGADEQLWACTAADCPGAISSLTIPIDGTIVAVGSVDGEVQVRAAADGQLVFWHDSGTPVTDVAFSPDGQTLAIGAADGSLTLWNYVSDTLLELEDAASPFGSAHADAVRAVAFSPQGDLLASGGQDSLVKLWQSADGALQHTLTDHQGWVTSLAFAPDGVLLVSGSEDRTVNITNLAEMQVLRTLREPEQSVTSLAFAPDGRTFAAGSDDTQVYVWRLDDGVLLGQITQHSDTVTSLAFTPDGRTLLSASNDQTINAQAFNRLVLSSETLSAIYLGEITNWSDPRIAADNPTMPLPDMPITVVHRLDSSGTTNIFTHYLSEVSAEWRDAIGASGRVAWPVGVAHDGNSGVSAAIVETPGAIGYVSSAHARQAHLPYALLTNATGTVTAPTYPALQAAMEQSNLPSDLRGMIVNAAGPDAYPIAGFTWLLVCEEMIQEPEAVAITDFLYWALTSQEAQGAAQALGFVPLSGSVQAQAEAKLEQIVVRGEPVFVAPEDTATFAPRRPTVFLTGSGASFPAPIYQRWIDRYSDINPNVVIRYNAVGSGKGRTDFFSGVVDFAGTDEFASDTELAEQSRCTPLHIPTLVGAVTVVYNLPEALPETE